MKRAALRELSTLVVVGRRMHSGSALKNRAVAASVDPDDPAMAATSAAGSDRGRPPTVSARAIHVGEGHRRRLRVCRCRRRRCVLVIVTRQTGGDSDGYNHDQDCSAAVAHEKRVARAELFGREFADADDGYASAWSARPGTGGRPGRALNRRFERVAIGRGRSTRTTSPPPGDDADTSLPAASLVPADVPFDVSRLHASSRARKARDPSSINRSRRSSARDRSGLFGDDAA